MSAEVPEFISDPWAAQGLQDVDAVIARHMALTIGYFNGSAGPIRAASQEEIAERQARNPEAFESLRTKVVDGLVRRSIIPAEYQPLQVVSETDAA